MKSLRLLACLLLSAVLLPSPLGGAVQGDVLTAHDGRGNIFMVYNTVEGRADSIRILHLRSDGILLWSLQRPSDFHERVYAAAMDAGGHLYLAGERRTEGKRSFLLMKYSADGSRLWEAVDTRHDCTALEAAVDDDGSVALAGICRVGRRHPARILKYGGDGSLMWVQEYDAGGRNYVRDLSSYRGDLAMMVETVTGSFETASNAMRVVVYDRSGQQVNP